MCEMKGLDWIRVATNIAFDNDLEHHSDAAFRTYIELLGISAYRLSDGRVARRDAQKLCNTRYLARALSELSASGHVLLEGDHIVLPKYSKWQETRETVERTRLVNSQRVALFRQPGLQKAVRDRDGDTCRYCGQKVNWHDRRGPKGGTYDHVIPDGGNDIENVVVCCRSCNSAKGGRTPEEWGVELIPIQNVSSSGPSSVQDKSKSKSKNKYISPPNPPLDEGGDEFDSFWELYPRKVGKAHARKIWTKLVERTDPQTVIAGLRRQLPYMRKKEKEFIPHPSTWLNQERWQDEVAPSDEEQIDKMLDAWCAL